MPAVEALAERLSVADHMKPVEMWSAFEELSAVLTANSNGTESSAPSEAVPEMPREPRRFTRWHAAGFLILAAATLYRYFLT